jgi:hypothetical protein
MERLHEIYSADRQRRVVFYKHQGDSFTFEEECWSDDPYERCWILRRSPDSICDSLETAKAEAAGRIDWLCDTQ